MAHKLREKTQDEFKFGYSANHVLLLNSIAPGDSLTMIHDAVFFFVYLSGLIILLYSLYTTAMLCACLDSSGSDPL